MPESKPSSSLANLKSRVRTRTVVVIATIIAASLPQPAGAQISFSVIAGAVVWSDLVRDSIVERIDVDSEVSPALGIAVGESVARGRAVQFRLTVSRGDVIRRERDTSTEVTTLLTWNPSLTFAQKIAGPLSARASIGLIIYAPSDRQGNLFQGDSPVRPTLGIGLSVATKVFGKDSSFGIDLDAHQFSTAALRSQGFAGHSTVRRVWIGAIIGIVGGGGRHEQ